MSKETRSAGLPVAVARRVVSQIQRLEDVTTKSHLRVGVSEHLMEVLRDGGAERPYRDELQEVLSTLTGCEITITLHINPELDHGHVSLTNSPATEREAEQPEVTPRVPEPDDHPADLMLSSGAQSVLVTGTLALGRSSSCDLVIEDPEASRRHAEIVTQDGRTVLRDLNSTNGTVVNGRVITSPTELNVGDIITVGSVHIEVVHP
jgi:hypothetical protein